MSFKNHLHLDNSDLGLFLLRSSIACLIFFTLGINKLELLFSGNQDFPLLPLMAAVELILPIFLLIGMFVRPISMFMILHFFVSALIVPLFANNYALVLMVPFLGLMFTGAGEISLKFKKFSRVTSLWL